MNYSPALKKYSFTYCRSNLSAFRPSKWLWIIISDRRFFFSFCWHELCLQYVSGWTHKLSICVDGLKLVAIAEAFRPSESHSTPQHESCILIYLIYDNLKGWWIYSIGHHNIVITKMIPEIWKEIVLTLECLSSVWTIFTICWVLWLSPSSWNLGKLILLYILKAALFTSITLLCRGSAVSLGCDHHL